MAVRQITSDPKPSTRIAGWWYAYYNKPTPQGGECTVIFTDAIKDLVRRGLCFDESCVTYDNALRASVLNLDFAEPQNLEGPALPPDPEAGWADPDGLPPSPPPKPQPEAAEQGNCGVIPMEAGVSVLRAGTRPPATRRREASQLAVQGCQLPAAALRINMEVNRSFQLQYALLSNVGEARRADVAQKLCAIASIPYYRQVGIELTEDDVKGMTAY